MTISLFKYNCALREDGKIYSTYGEFNEQLYNDVIETIGNEPAVFPIRFVFVPVNHLDGVMAQLFVLRHVKRYKVMVREKFIILIKRKQKLSNTLHVAPDGEFVF